MSKAADPQIIYNENSIDSLNNFIGESKYSKLVILTDSNTNNFCLPYFLENLATEVDIEIIEIEAGESLKTIQTCLHIWDAMIEMGCDRKTLMVNLGGGVITDLGGFAASTFKRGIKFINIPTSLLGMVDAALGGKNGVDLGNLKNQIGTINEPELISINTYYLQTLPPEQMRSGLAEMLKHGLIYDKEYWKSFSNLSDLDFDHLDVLIKRSVEIKMAIVSQDPTENGIRKALNFGHTLGHAIESHFMESSKPLLHGEAIAIGMVLESYVSLELGLLNDEEFSEIKSTILEFFPAVAFNDKDIQNVIALLIHDKKNEYGKVSFCLLDGIGAVKIDQNVDNFLILRAFADYLS